MAGARPAHAPSPAFAGEGWGEGRGIFGDPHPAPRATFSRKRGRREGDR
jgi:hypothetical protein